MMTPQSCRFWPSDNTSVLSRRSISTPGQTPLPLPMGAKHACQELLEPGQLSVLHCQGLDASIKLLQQVNIGLNIVRQFAQLVLVQVHSRQTLDVLPGFLDSIQLISHTSRSQVVFFVTNKE